MTYYDILGVPRYATTEQIKSAYREQMKFFHPDVFDGSPYVADVKSKQLNEAYAVLSVPAKRYEYDEKLYADDHAHLQDILKSRDDLRAQSAKDKSDNEKYVSFMRSELEKSTRKYQKFRGFAAIILLAVVLAFSIYVGSNSAPAARAVETARLQGYNAGFQAVLDASPEPETETVSDEPLSEYDSQPVWVTPSGSKYHLRSCSAISGHEVERTIRIEAEKAGYTACSKCKP
jgi:curved DNA-binding protein CbpA